MRPPNPSFLLSFLLFLPTLISAVGDTYQIPPGSYYHPQQPSSSPPSPATVPLRDSLVPSRVLYPDEDPEAARIAWFKDMNEQRLNSDGSWTYIEEPLSHPNENYVHDADRGQGKVFTFTAGGANHEDGEANAGKQDPPVPKATTKTATGEGPVMVEHYPVNLWGEGDSERRDKSLLHSPQGPSTSRRRGRFNEGLRQMTTATSLRDHNGRPRKPAPPIWPPPEQQQQQESVLSQTGTGGGMRENSPTRLALDRAALKLKSLQPLPPPGDSSGYDSATGEWGSARTRTPLSSSDGAGGRTNPISPPQGRYADVNENHTPPQYYNTMGRSSVGQYGIARTSLNSQLPPPSAPVPHEFGSRLENVNLEVVKIAPYRMWSVKSALPSINLPGVLKLTDRFPEDHSHFQSTLQTLSSHEWQNQLANRISWAALHRVEATSGHRVITPLGAVIGGDLTSSNPTFLTDPKHPMPQLDSITLTGKHKRINAWLELSKTLPPSLTGHSLGVWKDHSAEGWDDIGGGGAKETVGKGKAKEVHEAVHPIQYISLMLRDKNGAVVLENSIHDKLHQSLKETTPPEVISQLQALRAKEKGGKNRAGGVNETRGKSKFFDRYKGGSSGSSDNKGEGEHYLGDTNSKATRGGAETLEDLLGTQYTTHTKFWYHFYHNKPPIRIQNPLHTPLEEFAAFKPFADAVTLKKVIP